MGEESGGKKRHKRRPSHKLPIYRLQREGLQAGFLSFFLLNALPEMELLMQVNHCFLHPKDSRQGSFKNHSFVEITWNIRWGHDFKTPKKQKKLDNLCPIFWHKVIDFFDWWHHFPRVSGSSQWFAVVRIFLLFSEAHLIFFLLPNLQSRYRGFQNLMESYLFPKFSAIIPLTAKLKDVFNVFLCTIPTQEGASSFRW